MLLHHELVLLRDIHFVLQFILRVHLAIILIQRRNITKLLATRGIKLRILAHAYVYMVPSTQRPSLLLLLPRRLHLLIISIVRFRHLFPRQSRILDQRAPRIRLPARLGIPTSRILPINMLVRGVWNRVNVEALRQVMIIVKAYLLVEL